MPTNTRLFFPCLASLLIIGARTGLAADSNFDRTLSTAVAPSITISTEAGYVHLHAGADTQVHIVAHVRGNHGGSGAETDHAIEQIVHNPPIRQQGNQIIVGERHSSDLFRNVTIDYEITAPRNSLADIATGSGDLEIQDVGSSLKAQSGSGSVRARGIHGPAMLGTGSGDIELSETAEGDVRAQTGSGSIRLHDISGGLYAEAGSGDIEVSGTIRSDWKLDTGSGSIRLTLGSQARFTLDATSGSGGIRVSQSLTRSGDISGYHVVGQANGGGAKLIAQTGSGDIEIR